MTKLSYRYQRTIAGPAELVGAGFLTGADVRMRFLPAPPDHGVVFVRTDLKPAAHIPARIEQVTGTKRRTTLGQAPRQVGLVEHVLAALAGLHIDNCLIELNAPEPPGLDGSAMGFVYALLEAGVQRQSARRAICRVERTVVVSSGNSSLAIHPAKGAGLVMSYFLDYGLEAPIARQLYTQTLTPRVFAQEVAHCRTFLLEKEATELRKTGIGLRTTPADLLIFGPRGVIDNKVRFANEPARHKVLDMVGDLSLLGFDLCGHVIGCRSGHQLNIELCRLLADVACPAPALLRRAA